MRATEELYELCLAYTGFNAGRSLGNPRASAFEIIRSGTLRGAYDPGRPVPFYNRILGLTVDSLQDLPAMLERYAHADLEPQIDLAPEGVCPEVVGELLAAGFQPYTALTYLKAEPMEYLSSTLRVQRWTAERADDFLELLETSGVRCSPEIWQKRKVYYCTDTFRTHVAYVDDEPAAWGTLYVQDGLGYLANAYTQPAFRRKGCQSALITARLLDALNLGLRWVATDVVPASASHRNCRRSGFQDETSLTFWQRQPPEG